MDLESALSFSIPCYSKISWKANQAVHIFRSTYQNSVSAIRTISTQKAHLNTVHSRRRCLRDRFFIDSSYWPTDAFHSCRSLPRHFTASPLLRQRRAPLLSQYRTDASAQGGASLFQFSSTGKSGLVEALWTNSTPLRHWVVWGA